MAISKIYQNQLHIPNNKSDPTSVEGKGKLNTLKFFSDKLYVLMFLGKFSLEKDLLKFRANYLPQSPDYYPNGNEYLKDFPISDQIFKIHNFSLLLI